MRTLVALLTTALLVLGAPAPAGARGVPQQETTTTATASVSGTSVTVTIAVTAPADPVPEGTVEVTEGETSLGIVPLVDGTATWTGTATAGYHRYVATYAPADARWLPSASGPVGAAVGDCCRGEFPGEPPYRIAITAKKRVIVGRRTPITVQLRSSGRTVIEGSLRFGIAGPGAFHWSMNLKRVRGKVTAMSPRFARAGRYQLTVTVRPTTDNAPDARATTSIRVVKPRK